MARCVCCVFPHTKGFSSTSWVSFPLNRKSLQRWHWILQVKGSFPQNCQHLRCQSQVQVVHCTSVPLFIALCFIVLCRYCFFFLNKLEICGSLPLSKSISTVFQQHFLTLCLCHIFVILTKYRVFHYYLSWWSLSVIFIITAVNVLWRYCTHVRQWT